IAETMTRVVSGAVLIAFTVGMVWFAPPLPFLIVAAALVALGVNELVVLARASQLDVAFWPALVAALLVFLSVGAPGHPLEVALMASLLGIGLSTLAAWRGDGHALSSAAVGLFPALYLGLPVGALAAVRTLRGPRGLFLLMLTIIVSD